MKRLSIVLVIGVLVVVGLSATAAKEDPITGTWYGGSTFVEHAGFKYVYVFSPVGPDRWQLFCFIASSPAAYGGFAVMTPFAGEITKKPAGYELRLLSLGTATAAVPPSELPTIVAARAILTVVGPDEIKLVYDTAGAYAWGKVPFVDVANAWMYRPGNGGPVPETIHRMNTKVAINLQ